MDLVTVEVTFTDGKLTCLGHIEMAKSEFVGADDVSAYEQTEELTVHVVEDGLLYDDDGVSELEPGTYLVSGDGLYKRIDGTSSSE